MKETFVYDGWSHVIVDFEIDFAIRGDEIDFNSITPIGLSFRLPIEIGDVKYIFLSGRYASSSDIKIGEHCVAALHTDREANSELSAWCRDTWEMLKDSAKCRMVEMVAEAQQDP